MSYVAQFYKSILLLIVSLVIKIQVMGIQSRLKDLVDSDLRISLLENGTMLSRIALICAVVVLVDAAYALKVKSPHPKTNGAMTVLSILAGAFSLLNF